MAFNPVKHHRRSIRLHGYDYSQPGAYFVTMCVQKRECLFGKIVGGKTILNDAGKMIEKWYVELMKKYPHIKCDEHIVMPNHFHAIIFIVGADLRVCPQIKPSSQTGEHTGSPLREQLPSQTGEHIGSPLRRETNLKTNARNCINLLVIVQWFKTMTTNEYIRNVKTYGWPCFAGKLWQRNYYDHIGRDEKELYTVRQYIRNNPLNWDVDEENPISKSPRYVAMPNPQR